MLEGPRITLRLMTDADVEEYVKLQNVVVEQGEHLPPRLRSLRSIREHYEERKGWWDEHEGALLITDKADQMLGGIGFFRRSHHDSGYEIGYELLRREHRGQGYTTEALRIFSAYLFELKPIPRLQIVTTKGNVAARRVAEKCGYQLEGTLREGGFVRGEYVDVVIYGLLRGDCPSLAEVLRGS